MNNNFDFENVFYAFETVYNCKELWELPRELFISLIATTVDQYCANEKLDPIKDIYEPITIVRDEVENQVGPLKPM